MLEEINPIQDMLRFGLPEHVKEVQGKKIQKHYCFSCGQEFDVADAVWCPKCHWAVCPHCGSCACSLTPEAKMALRGIWLTFCQYCNNPCKRKAKEVEGEWIPDKNAPGGYRWVPKEGKK